MQANEDLLAGGSGGVGILGLGFYVPSRVVTNEEVEASTRLPSGTIEQKTGIRERHVVGDDEVASEMASSAAAEALAEAGIAATELDLILGCTFSADYVMPALACKIHQVLGAKKAGAFDLMANCTAFQVGLSVASDRLRSDPTLNYALVVGAAIVSRYLDWTDPDSAIYFGDGVGAAVLGRVPQGYGFLAHEVFTHSQAYEAVRLRGGSSARLNSVRPAGVTAYLEMNGLDVWKFAAQYQPVAIRRAIEKAGKKLADVDFFIFHQANFHLIDYIMKKMKISANRTFTNIDRLGNTAEASMAIALAEAVREKYLKHGDLVVISGVGAGFTFGASVMRWYDRRVALCDHSKDA
jgi:3-oxoacyl-[acyl-carrier-protein] synthase III